jgi:hypothetical protein
VAPEYPEGKPLIGSETEMLYGNNAAPRQEENCAPHNKLSTLNRIPTNPAFLVAEMFIEKLCNFVFIK